VTYDLPVDIWLMVIKPGKIITVWLARIFHQNNPPKSASLKADLKIQRSFMSMPAN